MATKGKGTGKVRAYPKGRPVDAEFDEDVRRLFAALYHVTLTDAQLEQLVAD